FTIMIADHIGAGGEVTLYETGITIRRKRAKGVYRWKDISSIRLRHRTQLPIMSQLVRRFLGFHDEVCVEIQLSHVIRVNVSGVGTTVGLGFPSFRKTVTLYPTDPEGFVRSTKRFRTSQA